MNKTIITVIIILIMIFGLYFVFRNSEPALQEERVPESEVMAEEEKMMKSEEEEAMMEGKGEMTAQTERAVVFSNSGYSPGALTIKKGETVTWKNQSSLSIWTASAKHPTHTVYPTTGGCLGSTFDACKGALPGESWSFKFDSAGEWGYHDHLHPNFFGKIVVTE